MLPLNKDKEPTSEAAVPSTDLPPNLHLANVWNANKNVYLYRVRGAPGPLQTPPPRARNREQGLPAMFRPFSVTLCYAILLPGQKPIFRTGIRPDCNR